MPRVALLIALLAAPPSEAGPLNWRWNVDQPVRWHTETVTLTPWGIWYLSMENLEARAIQTNLVVDMTCTPTEASASKWYIRCVLDDVALSGTAAQGEEQKLDAIFDEYERAFAGSSADFSFTASGRIRSLDLDAFEKTTSRSRDVEEVMRLTLLRAFALLEFELPGKAIRDGAHWNQKGTPLLMALRSSQGTAGGISLRHKVVTREGDIAVFETEGRATVTPGATVEANGAVLTSLMLAGQGRFDTSLGLLEYREYLAQAERTAGSSHALPAIQFKELGTLERIDPPLPEASRPVPVSPAPPPEPETVPDLQPADPPAQGHAPSP
ncbi:MAG: hypothetical protein JXB39_12320 [Deltaproteobacteria bacterium]|nr:hypothetical protein [Deltaproteobacteria bacterium]